MFPQIFGRSVKTAPAAPPAELAQQTPQPPSRRHISSFLERPKSRNNRSVMTRLETPGVFLYRMNGWLGSSEAPSGNRQKSGYVPTLMVENESSHTSRNTQMHSSFASGKECLENEYEKFYANEDESCDAAVSSEVGQYNEGTDENPGIIFGSNGPQLNEKKNDCRPSPPPPPPSPPPLAKADKKKASDQNPFLEGAAWTKKYNVNSFSSELEYSSWLRSLSGLEREEATKFCRDFKEVFYAPPSHRKAFDMDAEVMGKLKLQLSRGEHLLYRYEILTLLGRGKSSKVLGCYDHKSKRPVAIKVVDSSCWMKAIAREITALKLIRERWIEESAREVDGQSSVGEQHQHVFQRLHNIFSFRSNACFVFEVGGPNLYESLRRRNFKGFQLHFVRRVARQLLRGLLELRSLGIIHCDIKPENILLQDPISATVSLTDFGHSHTVSSGKPKEMYIQSRMYRCPEILMGLDYDFRIDIWSVAVTLVEIYRGTPLFRGRNGRDQMHRIAEVLGGPPVDVVKACRQNSECVGDYYFDKDNNMRDICTEQGGGAQLPAMVDDPFVQIDAAEELAAPRLGSDVDADSATNAFVCAVGAGTLQSLKLKPRRKFGSRPISEIIGNETEQKRLFSHFISEMLQWDPLARAEPEALLKHPFLSLGAGHGSGQLSLASISTAHNSSRSKRSESSRSRKSKEMAELQLPAVPK